MGYDFETIVQEVCSLCHYLCQSDLSHDQIPISLLLCYFNFFLVNEFSQTNSSAIVSISFLARDLKKSPYFNPTKIECIIIAIDNYFISTIAQVNLARQLLKDLSFPNLMFIREALVFLYTSKVEKCVKIDQLAV